MPEKAEAALGPRISPVVHLFLASFVALYFEALLIRYLATEIRLFAYLKNFPLIASFLGIGLGMLETRMSGRLTKAFPGIFAALFLVLLLAGPLNLAHIGMPSADYFVFGSVGLPGVPAHIQIVLFVLVTATLLSLIVAFFMPLGRFVGDGLSRVGGLKAYGINLTGSLFGVCLFTLLCFYWLPPMLWLSVGFAGLAPLFWNRKRALAAMAFVVLLSYHPSPDVLWSPYYRIDLHRSDKLEDWDRPHAYLLAVNHQYHQKMVDLSPEFLAAHPQVEPNRSAVVNYNLPYKLAPSAGSVLIVGAGTGNDVAAALRHGANRIDAVEIDPVIYDLGATYHPERPYDSEKVNVHIEDARAFFKKSQQQYELVVFAYLDAHTMLSSFSSLRLDNYVYTRESLKEARALLAPNGTLVLAFASGRAFVDERLYAMVKEAFDGVPPYVYRTDYDGAGLLYVHGAARNETVYEGAPEIGAALASGDVIVATDRWPFLYLRAKTIPLAMVVVLICFLIGSRRLVRAAGVGETVLRSPRTLRFLLLGAGFLLLQTKGVTEASLLFGSTWLTNAVVISGFLLMAILANLFIALRPVPLRISFAGLFVALAVNAFTPYTILGSLPLYPKMIAAALLVGLPVFFSGLVFSQLFKGAAAPAVALGANLLGAMIGGVLENLVMVGGTPVLAALALLLYGLAALATYRAEKSEPVMAAAAIAR